MSLLSVHNLSVKFGNVTAIQNISFEVNRGEVLAIVGPNGSGKSTLMKALLNLIPYTGQVHWHEPLGKVSYVPQHLLFDRTIPLTVREFLGLGNSGTLLSLRNAGLNKVNHSYIKDTKIEKLLDSKIGDLSGGELQRVFIAYALISEPKVLFLDEPSSGIDIGGEETVYTLIHDLSVKRGMTIVLISHDLDIVYEHANQVLCLNRRLVCRGVPHEALTKGTLEKLYGQHTGTYEHEADAHRHKK